MINRFVVVLLVISSFFANNLLADDTNFRDRGTNSSNHALQIQSNPPNRSNTGMLDPLLELRSTLDSSFVEYELSRMALEPPTGLSAQVYSSSALELFWDRETDRVLSYEVLQDGAGIGVTDGTSFFISSDLVPGISYSFAVIARLDDSTGISVSVPAQINVTVANSNVGAPVPTAPANVSIARYSASTAELFWDRAPSSERIVSTEIFRNDVFLGATDGTSFVDSSRAENESYEYTLVSVDADGVRSNESILLDGESPVIPPQSGLTVDETNLTEVLATIALVSRAEPVNNMMEVARGFLFADYDELLQSEPTEPQDSFRVTVESFSCDDGAGSLVRTITDMETSTSRVVRLEDCVILGTTYSGEMSSNPEGSFLISVNDFIASEPEVGSLVLTGIYGEIPNVRYLYADYFETDADGEVVFDLDYNGVESAFRIEDLNWQISGLVGGEEVIASADSNIRFERSAADGDFTVGTLDVIIDSGPTISINADNGDEMSFSVLVDDSGAVSSYTVDWTDENRYFLSYGSM